MKTTTSMIAIALLAATTLSSPAAASSIAAAAGEFGRSLLGVQDHPPVGNPYPPYGRGSIRPGYPPSPPPTSPWGHQPAYPQPYPQPAYSQPYPQAPYPPASYPPVSHAPTPHPQTPYPPGPSSLISPYNSPLLQNAVDPNNYWNGNTCKALNPRCGEAAYGAAALKNCIVAALSPPAGTLPTIKTEEVRPCLQQICANWGRGEYQAFFTSDYRAWVPSACNNQGFAVPISPINPPVPLPPPGAIDVNPSVGQPNTVSPANPASGVAPARILPPLHR